MELARINSEQSSERSQALPFQGDAWQCWGPYLSERAWGTVREDYSVDGCAPCQGLNIT